MSSRFALVFALIFAASTAARAYTVAVSEVHLCCNSCVKDADKAVAQVAGASAQAVKASGTITITAPDRATAQKAVDALVAEGYYGHSSDPTVTVAGTSVPDGNSKSLKVSGVHLCCKGCVRDLNKAVAKVKGVTGTTAAKDAESFEITGDFNSKDVIDALHAAGFSARVD
jgi:periplasmic mercuric ion binding protein